MRIIIEIANGPQQGQRFWLRADQVVQIGRSQWADVCVDDPAMADLHFAIYATASMCRARDLRGGGGLFVNELQVVEHSLVDGDLVRAGGTRFRVLIEGSQGESPPADHAYRHQVRANGLHCYRPVSAASPVELLLDQLAGVTRVYYLGWFDEWGRRRPAELKNSPDTIPASPNPLWGKFLPLLMAFSDLQSPAEYFQTAWKNRQVIAVLSDLKKPALLAFMREHPYLYSSLESAEHFLLTMPAEQLAPALVNLKGLVLPEGGNSWQLIANPEQAAAWADLGFELPPVT